MTLTTCGQVLYLENSSKTIVSTRLGMVSYTFNLSIWRWRQKDHGLQVTSVVKAELRAHTFIAVNASHKRNTTHLL